MEKEISPEALRSFSLPVFKAMRQSLVWNRGTEIFRIGSDTIGWTKTEFEIREA